MLCLVGDIAAKVPPNDAVPGGIVLLVKLLKEVKRKKSSNHYPDPDRSLHVLPYISPNQLCAAAIIQDTKVMSATNFLFSLSINTKIILSRT